MNDTNVITTRTPLLLARRIVEDIRRYSAEDYPRETCGALLGTDRTFIREVRILFPLMNRREDSPRNRFAVTPEDFRAAEEAAHQQGLEVVGWYHSHPDHPARPSDFDRQHAWPWYSYVIVNVAGGRPEKITSWLLADDRSGFNRQEIRRS